jgi:hypothetical protein
VVAIGRSSGRGIRANALGREGRLRGVEDVVGRLLSDIHFVVIKVMERGVAGRMRRVRVDGLVKVGKECWRGRVVRR